MYSSLRVTKKGQRINLYTGRGHLQSSYDPTKILTGTVWDWYLASPIFSGIFTKKLKNVLVLGLGGGTVVKLYNRAYEVEKIVGVEIDPAIIEIAKTFFNITEPNTEIINADIFNYIDSASSTFDVIILDAFRENISDPNSTTAGFLKKCCQLLTDKGVFVINRVRDKANLEGNKNLELELKNLYKDVYSLNIYSNIFYFCTNSPQAPGNFNQVVSLILAMISSNKKFSFMNQIKRIKFSILRPNGTGSAQTQ